MIYHYLLSTLFAIGISCSGILTVVPSNTAVYGGNETVLQCRTNTIPAPNTGRLVWRTQFSENDAIMTIYTGHKFIANITKELYNIINTTKGQFDLRIKAYNTTAQRYFCEEPGVSNASAELIVLASDPACSCTNDSTNSILRMECRLRYVGNWAPVMEWRQVSGEMENEAKLITAGITSNTSSYIVVSTLTVQRRATWSKYMCTTRFNAIGRPRSTTASNIPEYSYNWTYPNDTLLTSSRTSTPLGISSSEWISLKTTTSFGHSAEPNNFDIVPIIYALAAAFLGIGIAVLVALLRNIYCKDSKQTKPLHINRLNTSHEIDADFSDPRESQTTGTSSIRPDYEEISDDKFGDAVELPEHFKEEETVKRESPTIVLHVLPIAANKVVSVQRQTSVYCNIAPRRRVNTPPKEEDTEQLTAPYINATADSLPQPETVLLPPIPYANIYKPHELACPTRKSKDFCRLLKPIRDLPRQHPHECSESPNSSSPEEAISLAEDSNLVLDSTYVNVHEEQEPWLKLITSSSDKLIEDIPITVNEDTSILTPIKSVYEDDNISATNNSQELAAKVPNYATGELFSPGAPRRKRNYEDLTERIPSPPPVYACLVQTPDEIN